MSDASHTTARGDRSLAVRRLVGPDMAYEGSDPTGAVWVTACGRGRLRCVALFGGWRETIGADLGSAVMRALADAREARRLALAAAAQRAPLPLDDREFRELRTIAAATTVTGTGPCGWVTVTVIVPGEITDVSVAPALLQVSDPYVMREVTGAFQAAYAAAGT